MTITATQRQIALGQLISAAAMDPGGSALAPLPGLNPQTLATLLPGVTPAQIVSAIANAIGSAFDTQLSTVLANMVSAATVAKTDAQAIVTTETANVSAWTVV